MNKQIKEVFATQSKDNITVLILTSLLGPVGILFLFARKTINELQFASLLCMWFSVFWCRWITGFVFPSTYYEMFILGTLSYGGVILNPHRPESSVAAVTGVSLMMLVAALTGYLEVIAIRNIEHLISPIDMFVIGTGYLGYLLSSYLAWKKRPKA